MKKVIFSLSLLLLFNLIGYSQVSHLSLIYNSGARNLDNSVIKMVGTNDSLYVISQTSNGKGKFYRLDQDGKGYKVIWDFDNVNFEPYSLIANDTVIYGTTRFSKNWGGALFKYSLKDYSFNFIKDFNADEIQNPQVKYITDSCLWLSSQSSFNDNGSIFSIKKDGTGLKKIFNKFDDVKGTVPVDFTFYNNHIYVACIGGGSTYLDGSGGYTYSGSVIRINSDGTGYQNIIKGGNDKGTHPQSLIFKDNKLYGIFSSSGSNRSLGGQLFKSDLDGTSYDSIAAFKCRSLGKMLFTDSLIYGISCSQFFGFNPYTGALKVFEALDNPDLGVDMVVDPVRLNGNIYLSTQQGRSNDGGTIFKWTNRAPEINFKSISSNQNPNEVILNDLFTDPEGDSLTFTYDFDKNIISITESNGKIFITQLKTEETELKITANDGWNGYETYSLKLNEVNAIAPKASDNYIIVYPNPAHATLNIGTKTWESMEIFTLTGEIIRTYHYPENNIDISSLENGMYLIRCKIKDQFYVQKLIKN